ncbi:hypothetical protein BDM02DRAFT_3116147 [Thelephora ganbajun]|uniref:Uncharacterized protein n=1 Tax=Thelephora ganbajun TaxID=370292 RepID=A0ACB6ZDT0_THEGA|nr:hypothetical protein BDM02DRAFT_3116147 [Thelephora ganbajun]
MCNDGIPDVSLSGPDETGRSLTRALVQHSPQYQSRDLQPPKRGAIYEVPVEIFLRIFQLLAPPRTRDDAYTLLELTHVCQLWRIALINTPRMWATIFVTGDDRRSFVEMWLERSYPVPLEVIVTVSAKERHYLLCTCGKDGWWRLVPNEVNPCEWHFAFESLAQTKHLERIRMLNIHIAYVPRGEPMRLALESCQFFNLPPLQLTSFEWIDGAGYTRRLAVPHFPPTLRSLSFGGPWHHRLTKVNNLTSFAFGNYSEDISAEAFRTFMLNNQSLETLSLVSINLEGSSSGPPINLSSLKSFCIDYPPKNFSTLIRIPAIQRLSSLRISATSKDGDGWWTFCATGDEITFAIKYYLLDIAEVWEDLTGYANPTIRHVCLQSLPEDVGLISDEGSDVILLLTNAHTLEIGEGYVPLFYSGFMHDLKELGPQLKTPDKTGRSLTGALVQHSPQYQSRDPRPPKRGAIYEVPVEIFLRIFQLLVPLRTPDRPYTLLRLTRVCRFWRIALINTPRMWATIFVAAGDRRSFVEMWLERSYPVPLEVIVTVSVEGRRRPLCTCGKDVWERLIPNEINSCEWHFVFESLAQTKHSERIRTLNINFDDLYDPRGEQVRFSLEGCRFFNLPPLRLTSLEWRDRGTEHDAVLHFPPTLRFLSFSGPWHHQLTKVNNLTSFTLRNNFNEISVEAFRTFILNNQSLETLSLMYTEPEDDSSGPPVNLSNIKSFYIDCPSKTLSTFVRIPAIRRLSSLCISIREEGATWWTFCATGDGITFTVKHLLDEIVEAWEDLTGYASPTIRRVRLQSVPRHIHFNGRGGGEEILPLMNVHTLEIGDGYVPLFYSGFMDDLKELGPQLKTIRFEIPEGTDPFKKSDRYEGWGGSLLNNIEDLVKYRFEQGRPFSSVERMVVSESEWVNRQQDHVWRCFYDDRRLDQYIRPE